MKLLGQFRRALPVLALGTALLLAGSFSADGQLIVVPRPANESNLSYLTVRARPGKRVVAGWVELRNPGRRRQKVVLERVDGLTLDTLGSGYAPPGRPPQGAARWLLFRRHATWVAPHRRIDIPVIVAIPRTARSGEYLSGVSIAALPSIERITHGRGVAIDSELRYAIGVLVTVPGRLRRRLELRGAHIEMQPPGPVFIVDVRNPGNAVLRGVEGWITVTRADRRVERVRVYPGTFISHSEIEYPVRATGQRPTPGTIYTVRARLRYPGGATDMITTVTYRGSAGARAFARTAARR